MHKILSTAIMQRVPKQTLMRLLSHSYLLHVCVCRIQFGGLGQLCDGVLGGDDFIKTKEMRVWPGYDYLGWSQEALGHDSVDIEFDFEKPRVFHHMQVRYKALQVFKVVLVCNSA